MRIWAASVQSRWLSSRPRCCIRQAASGLQCAGRIGTGGPDRPQPNFKGESHALRALLVRRPAYCANVGVPGYGSIIIAALPPSCMDWFEHYNLHPEIEELNEAHGVISRLNASAVELVHLPGYVLTYVESSLLNGTRDEAKDEVGS